MPSPFVPTEGSEKSKPSAALARSMTSRCRRTATCRSTMRPVASESTIATGTSPKLSASRSMTGSAARRRTGSTSWGSR
ncbi:hypothetical protein ACFQV8_35280 [Pseudonocardia benzenivorans]